MTRAVARRVLVCGGRDFSDRALVFSELDKHSADWGPFEVVINGGATGADRWAREWAEARGILIVTFLADWKKFGPPAGPIRNQRMIDEGKPDLVIAFPGGAGTLDMMSKSSKAKLQSIWIIVDDAGRLALRDAGE
jgi:hypothetical protein